MFTAGIYHVLFICSLVGRRLDYFHFLTVVNDAAMNVAVYVSV